MQVPRSRERPPAMSRRTASRTVAVGPAMPNHQWWERVGATLLQATSSYRAWTKFEAWEEPAVDAFIIIKHLPPADWVERVSRRAAIVYVPVDYFGSLNDVAFAAKTLRHFDRIVVHDPALS